MFAYDTLFFAKANVQEAINLKVVSYEYYARLGQEINYEKSSIQFSRNTLEEV